MLRKNKQKNISEVDWKNQIKDIVEMDIRIGKNRVKIFPSVKTFNGKYLERSSNVDDKVSIVNNNSGLLPRSLTTLIQFQNTSILTDKKTIILSNKGSCKRKKKGQL